MAETEEHVPPAPRSHARGQAALIVVHPKLQAIPCPGDQEPIGRDWLNAHGVSDTKVSSCHATVSIRGGTARVEDLGSKNGTWVDGSPLRSEAAPLMDGNLLRIGTTLMVFKPELRGGLQPSPPIGHLVGPYGLRAISDRIEALARLGAQTVLLLGESGAGKELVARAIADKLGRGERYVAINVAAISRDLFESYLFGHVKGAFSGAVRDAPGVLGDYDGGAVFLDEIGELDVLLQPKLLRLLENREVQRVGAPRPERTDVVIIAGTNRDLSQSVDAGAFRKDLLARLGCHTVELPPLRRRREDILEIARALIARSKGRLDVGALDVEVVERLLLHAYPTNVRGLMRILNEIAMDDDPAIVEQLLGPTTPAGLAPTPERIAEAMMASNGNQTRAAARLGLSRPQLLRLLKKS